MVACDPRSHAVRCAVPKAPAPATDDKMRKCLLLGKKYFRTSSTPVKEVCGWDSQAEKASFTTISLWRKHSVTALLQPLLEKSEFGERIIFNSIL